MAQRALRRGLPRDLRATTYLLGFVVAAVVTILITRASLAAAGYPQLGGHGLHIAHVLWGGLLLGVAIVLALSYVGPVIRPITAIVGGVGFGLFLDEVGKYVTSTNDYFFQPAIAIMYFTVVLFVLLIQLIHRKAPTSGEMLAGALTEAAAGAAGGISSHRRDRAFDLVANAADDSGAPETVALLTALPDGPKELGDPLAAVARVVRAFGAKVVRTRAARVTTIVLLCLTSLGALITTLTIVVLDVFVHGTLAHDVDNVASIGGTVSATLAAICVVVGIVRHRTDRRDAYAWFQRAVLIDLLLTQVFVVSTEQLSALPSIIVDLIMLGVLTSARNAPVAQKR
jgi:hypothetical protein